MLALDNPRWQELRDAYGNGSELAGWLDELGSDSPDPTLWEELTSRICHQFTVYSATYAAIPHIVFYASRQPVTLRHEPLILVGLCHACSFLDDAPEIPADLAEEYSAAIKRAAELLPECLLHTSTESEFRYLLAALAGLRGFVDLAFVIEALDCALRCPSCESIISIMESTLNLHHARPKAAPSNSA